MSTLLHDLRFSLRLFSKSPGFTVAAIAVLALSIGVNTGVFSIVNELLFSPRGFPRPAEVQQIYTQNKITKAWRTFSYPAFLELQAQSTSFTGILAHALAVVGVGEGEATRRAQAAVVSANFFDVLEAPLARGRGFSAAEEHPRSGALVTIASHAYWKRTGYDPDLVGKTVRINERVFTIVGIAAANFSGTTVLVGPEFYFPLGCFDIITGGTEAEGKRTLENAAAHRLIPVGRLKPGVSPAQADAELRTLAPRLERPVAGEHEEHVLFARPLRRMATSSGAKNDGEVVLVGLLLMGMAAIVLLIAGLNLANMLLARGAARRREIAIRLALGGRRRRIVRQLLTEGAVLALAGGVGGWLLGSVAAHAIAASFAGQFPFVITFQGGATDPLLFAVIFGFCTLATLCFALGPALKLSRRDVLTDLKTQAGDDAVTRRRNRWLPRNLLVVAQIALSMGLLTAAGLFIRGALKAGSIETGFEADNTIVLEVDASLGGHTRTRTLELYRAATERLAALPGVQAASLAAFVPFGLSNSTRGVQRAGLNPARDATPATAAEGRIYGAQWNSVGADYFAAMGLPILRGRAFTKLEAETPNGLPVVIIDEALARDLWPDENAIGKRVQWGVFGASTLPRSLEVVGIVPASRMKLIQHHVRSVFVPFAQGYQSNAFLHVRANRTDTGIFDLIRSEVQAAAPGVSMFAMKTFRQHFNSSMQLWTVRAGAALFATFGGLALLLAVVGVYGVRAYSVARRTREIGIRMALGAEPHEVVGLIFREGLVMTLTGVGLGLLLALGLGQLLARLLYQVSPMDPFAFTIAPLVLIATALIASWLPARRATRVNPLHALRAE